MARANLVDTVAPPLESGTWLHGPQLDLAALGRNGILTLLYFWAASSGRSQRVIPALKRLVEQYGELAFTVIGIHVPVFAFERTDRSIERALDDLEIPWPTLNDADQRVAKQYGHRAWPRLLLVAPSGRISYDHLGSDRLPELEAAIRLGLYHLGRTLPSPILEPHVHRMATTCYPITPDRSFQPHELVPGQPLQVPFAGLGVAGVLAPHPTSLHRVRVALDGQPVPVAARGDDVSEHDLGTIVIVEAPRLFHLIASPQYLAPGLLELEALDTPVQLHRLEFNGC